MTEAWPDLAGRMVKGIHVLPVRVYYEDTDFSGAVYHANFLKFCERARSDCLRLMGIGQSRLEDRTLVVRRMVCDFLKPARIDDLLETHTRAVAATGARLELEQWIVRKGELLFRAEVTLALVNGQGRPRRITGPLAKAFSELSPVTQT